MQRSDVLRSAGMRFTCGFPYTVVLSISTGFVFGSFHFTFRRNTLTAETRISPGCSLQNIMLTCSGNLPGLLSYLAPDSAPVYPQR